MVTVRSKLWVVVARENELLQLGEINGPGIASWLPHPIPRLDLVSDESSPDGGPKLVRLRGTSELGVGRTF